jgi:hypothetical protein
LSTPQAKKQESLRALTIPQSFDPSVKFSIKAVKSLKKVLQQLPSRMTEWFEERSFARVCAFPKTKVKLHVRVECVHHQLCA